MKTLNTIIAVLVLTIATNASFGQKNYNGILESGLAMHTCAKTENVGTSLKVCPMQMAEGIVILKFANQPKGNYTVQIADENGVVLMTQNVIHDATTASQIVKFGKTLAGGTYTVNIVKPDNTKKSETVMLLM